jgi:hypothetical protein
VVYAKPLFGGPQQVLEYLGRYTHRAAISNRRLLQLEEGQVSFQWKDYCDANRPTGRGVNSMLRQIAAWRPPS